MPQVELSFLTPLNNSVQAGDKLYYISINTEIGGFSTHASNSDIIELGTIMSISFQGTGVNNGVLESFSFTLGNAPNPYPTPTTVTLLCQYETNTTLPVVGDYLFFSKDRGINEASIIGYYAKFKFENNSRQPAELFAATCDISESSK